MSRGERDVLIIGGGVAGLQCARELARRGLGSVVVEKAAFPGGHVAGFCCKATDRCRRCAACMLEDILHDVSSSDRIDLLLGTTLSEIERGDGRFSARLSRIPPRISAEKCTDCGECLVACPVAGALIRSPLDGGLVLDDGECVRFARGESCSACADACPENAVDLDAAAETWELDASVVIVACGFRPFDASQKKRFGYGRVQGVLTGLDLEFRLRHDRTLVEGNGDALKSVAFIQCVGSRDPRIGRNYCSRVCCGYALRMARLLRDRFSGLDPTMFYMDLQSFDRDFERRVEEARREVRLVRAMPSEVRPGEDGKPVVVYQGPEDDRVEEAFDLVVLSVGISPGASVERLGSLLGLEPNEDGFLGSAGEEVGTAVPGVFVAGTAQGPRSIEESIAHASRAAGEAAAFLAGNEEGGSR